MNSMSSAISSDVRPAPDESSSYGGDDVLMQVKFISTFKPHEVDDRTAAPSEAYFIYSSS